MTGWLLDANILSELRRPPAGAEGARFVASQPLELLHISIVTLAEIRFGIELVPNPARRLNGSMPDSKAKEAWISW